MDCSHRYFIFASFILTLQTADGAGTITWNEPPPQETTADANLIRTHNTQLNQGSTNVPLSWNFSLAADLNPLQGVQLEFGGVNIVNIAPAFGRADVVNAFKGRFNLTWINPQKATLIIFNVSSADEGLFACKVTTLGGGSTIWQRNIQVTVVVPPSITHISGNQTVIEGQNVTLNCEASGDPAPNIAWTRLSDNSTVTMPLINIRRQEEGCYRCTADNGVGSPTTRVTCIIVHFPPNITDISKDQTVHVDEGDIVALNCTADGNPVPTITWTRLSDNSSVNRLLNISGKEVEGFYRCTAGNGIGIADTSDIFIYVQNYHPTDTNLTTTLTNNTVVLNDPFNLTCKADANPPAHYRFYKQKQPLTTITDNQAVGTFPTSIGERIKQVTYSCTPNNSFGVGQSDTAIVTVHFPPSNTSSGRNETISLGRPFNFTCPVDGNPPPSIRWYNSSGSLLSSEKEFEFIPNSLGDTGLYTCFASNYLGNTSVSFGLKVAPVTPTSPATPACGHLHTDVHVTCEVTNKDCKNPRDVAQVEQEFFDKVYSEGNRHFPHLNCVNGNVTGCGSVIVDLVLRFSQSVSTNDVISILKDAARNGNFGQFTVDPDSVKLTSTVKVFSSEPTKGPPPCKKSFFQNDDCSVNWLHLILIIVVAVVLIIIIAAAGGCWIHKKRKCRKDTRIACDPGSEEQRLQRDDPYAQVNNGYAETGPRSVNSREKGAAAVPDYAVVDKSAKKKKKQDEEKPPDYAVVDKSKKTKKNEKGDDTYAKVDMSKKTSKKKRKPGEEMLYADLGDFSGASQMPTVATSPKAQAQLPPIKRPESYEGTQYADITQFLKGDATLPIDDKQGDQQGAELKEKEGKTDGAGGENAPKETPM